MTYIYYGCYNNPKLNNPELNAIPIGQPNANTIELCESAANANGSFIFGLTQQGTQNICFISNKDNTLTEQLNQSTQYGLYEGSGNTLPICDNMIGSGNEPEYSTSVFVNEDALTFFDTQIGGNMVQKNIYKNYLTNLNRQFNKKVSDMRNLFGDITTDSNPNGLTADNYTNIQSNFDKLEEIILDYLAFQSILESMCNRLNVNINRLNDTISSLDEDNYFAQNKMTHLYATDNAAIGLAVDNNFISNIKITENIMFIVSIIIFAKVVSYLESEN